MSEQQPDLAGRSMTQWAIALRAYGLEAVAEQIDSDKLTSLRSLEELGLPTYPHTITPVQEFLADPQRYFAPLGAERCFTILAPMDPTQERFRRPSLDADGVVDFIKTTLPLARHDRYVAIIESSFRHYYGGNIVCDRSGSVRVEMCSGAYGHNRVIGGDVPEYTADRHPFTGRMEYSFEDTELRQAVWRTLSSIPRNTLGEQHFGFDFHPGYYEFYLDRRSADAALEPFFIDYSAQQPFRLQTVR